MILNNDERNHFEKKGGKTKVNESEEQKWETRTEIRTRMKDQMISKEI